VALAVFAADTVEITAGLGRNLRADPVRAAREAVDQARSKASSPTRLCIALPMVGGYDSRAVLDGLRAALGPHIPILGGGASPEDPAASIGVTESRQIVGREVTEDSIAILVLYFFVDDPDDKIPLGPLKVKEEVSAEK
jgi:hypothetical protein